MDDAKPVRDTIARYRSEAYQKGATEMRERAAKLMDTTPWATPNKGDRIRALPLDTEKAAPAGEG